MSKRVYISADYSPTNGDRAVVEKLTSWGCDNSHRTDYIDMAGVASGSISSNPDCRICDLKREFNQQINASSAVIFIVGDMTAKRTAGCACSRYGNAQFNSFCTPYKQNTNGTKVCKVDTVFTPGDSDDFGEINQYSYLRHEFEQAKKKKKPIIILYNSSRRESSWLPSYMQEYEYLAQPFWIIDSHGYRYGNYQFIKEVLGF